MSAEKRAVIELTLIEPKTLNDVVKWAEIAGQIGVPSTSTVSVATVPAHKLSVLAYLAQVPFPEADE